MSPRQLAPTAIDLFAGAGGLSEGLKQAGFRVLGAVELDPLAAIAYRLNHPSVRLWEKDIRGITSAEVRKTLGLSQGSLDLLAACPPCQGFSTLRTRNGKKSNRDPRNRLIGEVGRLVKELCPKVVMLENVPGLARSSQFRAFQRTLREAGYQLAWKILNVVDFGVAQKRRRLVLLASRVGQPAFAAEARTGKTVRKAIGHLSAPSKSSDYLHNYEVNRAPAVVKRIKAIPKNGGSRDALTGRNVLRCHAKSDGFKDVYGRMSWDHPAPTITGGCINPSKGRFLHPTQNRAITLREAALLQSFPRTYRFPLERGRYLAALLIGNALPPEFVRRHAVAVRRVMLVA